MDKGCQVGLEECSSSSVKDMNNHIRTSSKDCSFDMYSKDLSPLSKMLVVPQG